MTKGPVVMEPFSVHSGAFAEDPYPILALLREEAPAYRHADLEGWWVTRYEDVRAVVVDEERFLPAGSSAGPGVLTMMYGEEHRIYRALVTPAFGVGRLRRSLGPFLRELVDDLIDGFADAGAVDLVRDFANPIPAAVMCRVLQIEGFDADAFMRDAETFLESLAQPHNAQLAAEAPGAIQRVRAFIEDVVSQERAEPKGGFLTELMESEVEGRRLSDDDVAGFSALLLIAGVETTQRLISNMTYALCRHPEQFDLLLAEPDLLVPAIEETLRYLPPNQFRMRTVRLPVELHGQALTPGDRVYALTGGANRDPRAFDAPDTFDIRRFVDPRRVKPHMSFGWGPHFCLGAFLSKLETEYAMRGLLSRLQNIRLGTDRVVFNGFRNRSPETLPLLFEPAARAASPAP